MDHEEAGREWQYNAYRGRYARELHEQALPGQKLEGENDEAFADQLARKVKHELQAEKTFLHHPRLLLGIVSLGVLVCLFGLLLFALVLGVRGSSVGFAFLIACIAIVAVNGYFNWASIAMQRHQTLSLAGDLEPGVSAVACIPLPAAGKPATITYQGRLAVTAASITMHWGYSNWRDGFMLHWGHTYWNGVTDTQMVKQSNGTWQASIIIPSGATSLNMAFRNQSNIWDNNNNSNYHLNVRYT
jgi:uncharacterized membrane protein YidH (DUF202 family)